MGASKDLFMQTNENGGEAKISLPVKKSIFNIESEYLELMQEIEYAEGELTPELEERLTINKEDLEKKAVSYGYYIKTIDNDAVLVKTEIDRLQRILKAKEKQSEDLKERIKNAMIKHGIQKIQLNNLTLSFRASRSLEIDNTSDIPTGYVTYEIVPKYDKVELKKDVIAGSEYKGIRIVENQNLQIK